MNKRIVLTFMVLMMVVSLAMSASAIDLSSLTSFLYGGSSYIPLKSAANFLNAPLQWNGDSGQTVVTYQGKDFVLTPNSRQAWYDGRRVELSSPPVVVNGVTYIPMETFKKYYNVPVTYDRTRSEMRMKGPNGWRTIRTNSRPPWHGGPPPWAPAWGQRQKGAPTNYAKPRGNSNRKAWQQPRYNTHGHLSNAKPRGNSSGKAWQQPRYHTQGHLSNTKLNVNGTGKAWQQSGYHTQGHLSNAKSNGNEKAKSHKKDH